MIITDLYIIIKVCKDTTVFQWFKIIIFRMYIMINKKCIVAIISVKTALDKNYSKHLDILA